MSDQSDLELRAALEQLAVGEDLSVDQASGIMHRIMSGELAPVQIGAVLMGLRAKGEAVSEITAFARVMREFAVPLVAPAGAVDTCGTGGDNSGSFNVSTACAFVVAACGVPVAKHGNRAMSSSCGSADVLEASGAVIDLDVQQVESVLRDTGFAFMFAPRFHPAMRHVAIPRRELRIRTVFNVLGPLTNPARVDHQVLGVADGEIAERMAHVLASLGLRHGLVVHGTDGLDEMSIAAPTVVHEIRDGTIVTYEVAPEDAGLQRSSLDLIRGGDPTTNARIMAQVLDGQAGACRDVVVLNAAAALVAADRAQDLHSAAAMAADAIDSGAARNRLEAFVQATRAVV